MAKMAKAVKRWSGLFGVPALIIALLIAGALVTAYEFFGEPEPLDAAIQKDLQNSEEEQAEPAAPASNTASDEGSGR